MKCKGFCLTSMEPWWIHCRWLNVRGLTGPSVRINPQQVLEFIHGKQAITSLRHFMPDADEARLQEEFDWLEALESRDTDGIAALPGAAALIARLDALAIPWGS